MHNNQASNVLNWAFLGNKLRSDTEFEVLVKVYTKLFVANKLVQSQSSIEEVVQRI